MLLHKKKNWAIVGTEGGEGWNDGREGEERSCEKGGKAEINTALIDSTRTHAKLHEE